MRINYQVLDKLLLDLASLGDGQISAQCEEDIGKFVQNHDTTIMNKESLKQLSYAANGWLGETYSAITGEYLPNIFANKEF